MKGIKEVCFACMALGVVATAQGAESYPARPITLIIGFPPGGGADNVGRIYANSLSRLLKQPVVIENRPGAGSTIGAAQAAKAKPDGYTLYLGNSSVMGSDSVLYSVSYTPDDFMPVARLTIAPMILIASKKSGISSVEDLLQRARKAPNTINVASSGNGVITHLAAVEFMSASATKLMHIPFKGGAPATQSVAAGDTDISFATAPSARSAIDTGKAIGLGITTAQPSSLIPQYRPIADLGVPGYNIANWWGIFVPKGTPAAAVDVLFKATNEILADKDVRQNFASGYEDVAPSASVEEFAKFARQEGEQGLRLAKASRETAN
ncbi:Bug family tripartite tricarboxylate transporter substrate binding protein [Pollutimonas bauzanensis]|uniref:Tripartite-type tricarboxylate transporter, receptor component TctC n=1 Tax=Pollutimonas bauzanensis TaxID=658167 RepID=A0A1M5NAK9_9BURK|nr:tripartite tricarboxylate transporter substrate-binding protein [Pollutimonas bauzanensis]SHG86525.1 Tripartite-type tricarboxylate transporter, receptor component TctC [Pollutimonas bauzanensis]